MHRTTQLATLEAAPDNETSPSGPAVGSPVRVGRLESLISVRAELAKLYREARRRHGRYPDALTASRLAAILSDVRASIELEAVRERLDALEARIGKEAP